jgi:hypothetical protein
MERFCEICQKQKQICSQVCEKCFDMIMDNYHLCPKCLYRFDDDLKVQCFCQGQHEYWTEDDKRKNLSHLMTYRDYTYILKTRASKNPNTVIESKDDGDETLTHPESCLIPETAMSPCYLRTDGVYVQFGTRPWKSVYFETENCWYNLMVVVNEKLLIVLGTVSNPFFELNPLTNHPQEARVLTVKSQVNAWINETETVSIEVVEKHVCYCVDDPDCKDEDNSIEKCDCYDQTGKNYYDNAHRDLIRVRGTYISSEILESQDYYEYFGLDPHNLDPLVVVRKLKSFDFETRSKQDPNCVNQWNLRTPITGKKTLGWAQDNQCNDDFTLYYKSDPLVMFDHGSPGRVEQESPNDWYGVDHNFPLYFIPFDLSDASWRPNYNKFNKLLNSIKSKSP